MIFPLLICKVNGYKRKTVSFLTSFANQMTPCGVATASLETPWATVCLGGVNYFNICIVVIWTVVCSTHFQKQQQSKHLTLNLQSVQFCKLSAVYRTNDSLWSDKLQFSHPFVTVQMTLRISAPAHYKPELNYTTICPCICFKPTLNSVWNPFSTVSI